MKTWKQTWRADRSGPADGDYSTFHLQLWAESASQGLESLAQESLFERDVAAARFLSAVSWKWCARPEMQRDRCMHSAFPSICYEWRLYSSRIAYDLESPTDTEHEAPSSDMLTQVHKDLVRRARAIDIGRKPTCVIMVRSSAFCG